MPLKFIEGSPNYGGDRFESLHSVRTITGDNKQLITLTGIVRIDLQGTSSKHWRREEVIIEPRINYIPKNRALQVQHWAPFVTINAIYNKDRAVNAGWAVNNFWIELPRDRKITYRNPHVKVKTRVLVRDTDGWLFRVGYQVTVSGTLVEWIWEPVD